MSSLVYNGFDFGEFCLAKTVSLPPVCVGADGELVPLEIEVKIMLNIGAKMDASARSVLRHRLSAALMSEGGVLRLPEEPEVEYRGVRVKDAGAWTSLFEDGSCTVRFECADPVAYGYERVTGAASFEVAGTYPTYPVIELVADAGDSVYVMNPTQEAFVQVVGNFEGGEVVTLDFEAERAWIDGVSADTKVGLYSDFFALGTGMNTLTFAGCASHTLRYIERWV